MQVEIITIGNEILSGTTLDTNFQYLANQLTKSGITVSRHVTVKDNYEEMKEVFLAALFRSDIIITTGGLGPTLDDITKDVVADVFQTKLEKSDKVEEDLKQRYGSRSIAIEEQSLIPKLSQPLLNTVGTAPGLYFKKDKKHFFVLPGVPLEMKTMFQVSVSQILEAVCDHVEKKYVKSIYLCHLPELAVDPHLRDLDKIYPEVEKGVYPSYGHLSVEFKLKEINKAKALDILSACQEKIQEEFFTHVYSKEDKRIEKALHEYFINNQLKLACAESITGGHIASKLTNLPGASKYFIGSVVSYSNHLKKCLLHVDDTVLAEKGAVSKEVAKQMAEEVLKISLADFSIAVTGIAGPDGGSQEKPIGTVWIGIAQKKSKTLVWKIQAKGSAKRESVIEYTANYALGALWRLVVYGESSINDE